MITCRSLNTIVLKGVEILDNAIRYMSRIKSISGYVSGKFPFIPVVEACLELEVLDISYSGITDEEFEALVDLHSDSLVNLGIECQFESEEATTKLRNLTKLKRLSLENMFTDRPERLNRIIVNSIKRLESLEELELEFTYFKTADLSILFSNMESLKSLSMTHCCLDRVVLKRILELPNLKSLDLEFIDGFSSNSFGFAFENISCQLENLKLLNLYNTPEDTLIKILTNQKQLKKLSLKGEEITDKVLEAISKLPLKKLSLSGTSAEMATYENIFRTGNLQNLTHLKIRDSGNLMVCPILESIAENCPKLEELVITNSLTGSSDLDFGTPAIKDFVTRCPRIKYFEDDITELNYDELEARYKIFNNPLY